MVLSVRLALGLSVWCCFSFCVGAAFAHSGAHMGVGWEGGVVCSRSMRNLTSEERTQMQKATFRLNSFTNLGARRQLMRALGCACGDIVVIPPCRVIKPIARGRSPAIPTPSTRVPLRPLSPRCHERRLTAHSKGRAYSRAYQPCHSRAGCLSSCSPRCS